MFQPRIGFRVVSGNEADGETKSFWGSFDNRRSVRLFSFLYDVCIQE